MDQLMHEDILQQVLRFLHKLGIQANVPALVVAASPLRFHPLYEILLNSHSQARLPLSDKGGMASWSSCETGIRNDSGLESTPGSAVIILPIRNGKAVPYPFASLES